MTCYTVARERIKKGVKKTLESQTTLKPSPSNSPGYIFPHLPLIDGFVNDGYTKWEIAIDENFFPMSFE